MPRQMIERGKKLYCRSWLIKKRLQLSLVNKPCAAWGVWMNRKVTTDLLIKAGLSWISVLTTPFTYNVWSPGFYLESASLSVQSKILWNAAGTTDRELHIFGVPSTTQTLPEPFSETMRSHYFSSSLSLEETPNWQLILFWVPSHSKHT